MKTRTISPFVLFPFAMLFLSVFVAFSLACFWEFGLESWLLPKDETETLKDHWEYVLTSTTFVIIALIIPTLVAYRLERQREETLTRLAESEKWFRSLFHGSIAAKLLVERDSCKIVEANRAAANFFNKDISLIIGASLKDLEPSACSELYAVVNSGQTLASKVVNGQDGRSIGIFIWPLEVNAAPHYQIIAHHVTAQQLAEEDQRLMAAIYSTACEGIMVTDQNGFIISANEAFCRMTGYAERELIGKTPRIFQSGSHDAHFYSRMWESLLQSGVWRGEIWNKLNSGGIRPYAASITAIRDKKNAISKFSAIYYDISERKHLEEALRYQAELDALTGIYNRRKFDELMKNEWRRARRESHPLSLAMLDIDNFKKFNDTYGHLCGDERIRQVAMIIQESLRRPTDYAARYGGEEFAVILPSTDMKGAFHVAERIRKRIEEKGAAETMPLTISAGVAASTDFDTDDFVRLVLLADKALYKSKTDGRNRVTTGEAK